MKCEQTQRADKTISEQNSEMHVCSHFAALDISKRSVIRLLGRRSLLSASRRCSASILSCLGVVLASEHRYRAEAREIRQLLAFRRPEGTLSSRQSRSSQNMPERVRSQTTNSPREKDIKCIFPNSLFSIGKHKVRKG